MGKAGRYGGRRCGHVVKRRCGAAVCWGIAHGVQWLMGEKEVEGGGHVALWEVVAGVEGVQRWQETWERQAGQAGKGMVYSEQVYVGEC